MSKPCLFDFNSPDLEARILGRSHSLFADAIAANEERLAAAIANRRVLVVGAAGSIGQAFVKQLVKYRPALLHLVDLSENALVELVRELRSSDVMLPNDFETYAVDFGSEQFGHIVRTRGPYDVFLGFAAMKHVRSERNVESLLRMIDTNVRYLDRYLKSASARHLERAFSVSTDKTVRPASVMGATKNLMEKALFSCGNSYNASSARFANVAFSSGSLLQGFGLRLAKRQPIAAPIGIRRYFITHEEAGQLCLLACFCGDNLDVFFPNLDGSSDLIELTEMARRYLAYHGLTPLPCSSEEDARSRTNWRTGEWPCYFSPSDTSGEKSYEEFCRETDTPDFSAYRNIGVVTERPAPGSTIDQFLAEIDRITSGERWSKEAMVEAIRRAVPELDHVELNRNLDQKM